MSHNPRKHLPTIVKQCTVCPNTFMSVGSGTGAVDIRLAFPRPVGIDNYGRNAVGVCPIHPKNR